MVVFCHYAQVQFRVPVESSEPASAGRRGGRQVRRPSRGWHVAAGGATVVWAPAAARRASEANLNGQPHDRARPGPRAAPANLAAPAQCQAAAAAPGPLRETAR
jgi:hypothetical protein